MVPLTEAYRDVLRRDPCVYCGRLAQQLAPIDRWPITLEHIVPKSEGGRNSWENLAAACYSCNRRRQSTPLLLYLVAGRPLRPGKHRMARMRDAERRYSKRFTFRHRGPLTFRMSGWSRLE